MVLPPQIVSVCSSQDGRIEMLVILTGAPGYVLHSNQTKALTWASWDICDGNSSKLTV
jgi:hypothetical protein